MNNLPHIDILIASYNSEKWVEQCISAIDKTDYPNKYLHIYVCDNASTDLSVVKTKEALERFNLDHEILTLEKNVGFGLANNKAAALGSSPYLFCLNYDTEICAEALKLWVQYIHDDRTESTGTYEFCQEPNEHPKIYNPATLETSWNSAAALIIKRHVFEEVGGFDEKIFMYCEDVDLSWRIRSKGYKLRYLHFCKVQHHTYTNHYGESLKIVNSIIYNMLLRYRYGNLLIILKGYTQLLTHLIDRHFSGSKKELVKKFLLHFRNAPYFVRTRVQLDQPKFYYWDFEHHRYGANINPPIQSGKPLVSIIIRTHKRPELLAEAIKSIQYQTYKNWEIIVAEDGGNTAKALIESIDDPRIKFLPSNDKLGRSATGNRALEAAKGDYFNFLDDDDFFFPDHLETLVNFIQISKSDAVYALGIEAQTNFDKDFNKGYNIEKYKMPIFTEYSRFTMAVMNFLPIQTVLFKKELFESYGGFNEQLEYLEDWDLWYRYSINKDFRLYPKATSIYKVPRNKSVAHERQIKLDENLEMIREKHKVQNRELFGSELPEMHIGSSHKYISSRISLIDFLLYKKELATVKGKLYYQMILFIVKSTQKLKKLIPSGK